MKHIRTLMDEVAQNIEIDEGRMKDIFSMDQEGQSVKEVMKDYPDINRSLIFKIKANPIKYSLPENDIK